MSLASTRAEIPTDPVIPACAAAPDPQAGLRIREAIEEDLPVVLELLQELGPAEAPLPLPRAQAMFAAMLATRRVRVWLAETAAGPVGTYTLLIMDNLCHGGTPSAIVESVVVAAGARGGRIGEAMMHHAMDCARQAGCYKLVLSSNNRRIDAHRFYRRLGFAQHGVSFMVETSGQAHV